MSYNKFLVIVFAILIITTGCSTVMVPEYPVKGVQTNTVDNTTPGKEVRTEEFYLTKEGAKYKLALAREETKRAKARARAENPCSTWFMAPSFCYGYSGGGVVVGQREGGRNGYFNSN